MTVPGYPPSLPDLAFGIAQRPDLVVSLEALGVRAAELKVETERRIAGWREGASAALHAEFRTLIEASAEQLDVLATLLKDIGLDVDPASWKQELSAEDAAFAWASASETCVLALLDWAADTEGVLPEHNAPKSAAEKLDGAEFLRSSGLPPSQQAYALEVAWNAVLPSMVDVPILYRRRHFVIRRHEGEVEVSHLR